MTMSIILQVHVIAAGGIYDGRGLAASLMYGAQAVWVGTRFVASTEAAAPKKHKELYVFLIFFLPVLYRYGELIGPIGFYRPITVMLTRL